MDRWKDEQANRQTAGKYVDELFQNESKVCLQIVDR